jgi:hypothetical protein
LRHAGHVDAESVRLGVRASDDGQRDDGGHRGEAARASGHGCTKSTTPFTWVVGPKRWHRRHADNVPSTLG